MSANRTCDHDALPDLQGIPGLPMDRSVFVIPNWNESFVGMTKCCAPNEVHISGDYGFEGCVLWCLIPDSFLKTRDGQKLEEGAVLDQMSHCIRAKTGISRYISGGQVKNNAASSRTTLLGVGVWALLAVGLLV
ncbi:uncharacterized protein B0T23DRAFT_388798 [Neurospora hispaniola]|uniref:Uncharacterized protein n=1 Tax=Neurospora hispaniola TaxID=588809 RepID=A0AAJ0MMB9_9PEZI|nr:hypothetical protein B0T23DRAFT_388798 [Neurospora hispaniola]